MGVLNRPSRREMLVGTGILGAGALAGLVSGCGTGSASDAGSLPTALVGAWSLDVTLDDGTKHQALILCTHDGAVGATAALAQDSFFNGFGVWKGSGGQGLITFEGVIFTGGTFDGFLRVRAEPTIDHTGDQLTSRAQFDVQPAGASAFKARGGASWTGSRIKALALTK